MQFEASLENLHSMLQWVLSEIQDIGFDRSSLNKIELASEEAIVNIFKHSYQGRSDSIEIEVKTQPSICEVVIKDHGPPFNPLKWKGTSSLEEVGGSGIRLILKSMDDVHYKREKDQNILTLIKKRPIRSSFQKR